MTNASDGASPVDAMRRDEPNSTIWVRQRCESRRLLQRHNKAQHRDVKRPYDVGGEQDGRPSDARLCGTATELGGCLAGV